MVLQIDKLIMKPFDGYALIYIYMCLHDNDYVMDFYFRVILRSTTGPYGRPMIKVAYGKILFTSPRLYGR